MNDYFDYFDYDPKTMVSNPKTPNPMCDPNPIPINHIYLSVFYKIMHN